MRIEDILLEEIKELKRRVSKLERHVITEHEKPKSAYDLNRIANRRKKK